MILKRSPIHQVSKVTRPLYKSIHTLEPKPILWCMNKKIIVAQGQSNYPSNSTIKPVQGRDGTIGNSLQPWSSTYTRFQQQQLAYGCKCYQGCSVRNSRTGIWQVIQPEFYRSYLEQLHKKPFSRGVKIDDFTLFLVEDNQSIVEHIARFTTQCGGALEL